jgi:mRNA-degrading endonuclease RelE of RelBE toxin-antitoxin system
VKVLVSQQVITRLRSLHPDQRKKIRLGLDALSKNRGDLKQLTGALSDYHRLRIGRFRVVFRYEDDLIKVIFLEERSIVYELFRP